MLVSKDIGYILDDYHQTEYYKQDYLQIVILEEEGGFYVEALSDYGQYIKRGNRFYIGVSLNPDAEKWCMAVHREYYETLKPGRILNIKFYEEGTVENRIVTYMVAIN